MAMDARLDQLSEAKEVDLPDAILPIQTLNSDDQYVWEFVRTFILSQSILKRGNRYGDTVPGQTDKREGEPAFYLRIEEAEDADDDPTTTLYFYTGEKGEDWIEITTGSGSGGTSADLPDLATDDEMEDGSLTSARQVSPHLIQLAIEALGITVIAGDGIEITGDGTEKTISLADDATVDIHELSTTEIEDEDSDVQGTISGERFKEAYDEHSHELSTSEIEDESSNVQGTVSGERFKEGFDEHADDLGLGEDNVKSDWDEEDETHHAFIENKPDLAPSDAEVNVNADWDSDTGDSEILHKPTLAPANAEENVKSDWDADSGDAEILHKPAIPDAGENNVQSDWNEEDTTDHAYIDNKPPTITQDQTDKLEGIEDEATADQTAGDITGLLVNGIRDEHIADDLSEEDQGSIRTKIGATDFDLNVDDETIEEDDTDGLRVKADGLDDSHVSDSLDDTQKESYRTKIGADTVDIDDVTIEDDATDGLRVKEGGLDDSHVKANLTDNEKQEFRTKIDATDVTPNIVNTSDVGSATGLDLSTATTFVSTGITLPPTSETEWILINFDRGEWHRVALSDLLGLDAAIVGGTPSDDTRILIIDSVLGNFDVSLGRTTADILLISSSGSLGNSAVIAVKKIGSEDGSGVGGSTNITIERDADSVDVQSSTGLDDTIPAADTDNAGVMTADQFDELEALKNVAQGDGITITENADGEDEIAVDDDYVDGLIDGGDQWLEHFSLPYVTDFDTVTSDRWSRITGDAAIEIHPHADKRSIISALVDGSKIQVRNVNGTVRNTFTLDADVPAIDTDGNYELSGSWETSPPNFTNSVNYGLYFTVNRLHRVSTDGTTIDGSGASDNPIGVVDDGIGSDQLANDSVGSDQLQDDSVDHQHLADNAVRQAHVADNTIGSDELENESVRDEHVADDLSTSEEGNVREKIGIKTDAFTKDVRASDVSHTGDVIFLTVSPEYPTLKHGDAFRFKPKSTNTGNSVVRISGQTSNHSIRRSDGGHFAADELPVGRKITIAYNIDDGHFFSDFEPETLTLDIHEDITQERTVLSDADRFILSHESLTGDPTVYVELVDLEEHIRPTIKDDDVDVQTSPANIDFTGGVDATTNAGRDVTIHVPPNPAVQDDGTEVDAEPEHINFTGNVEVTQDSDGVEVNIPTSGIAVDDETIENDSTDGLRVKDGGIDDAKIKADMTEAEQEDFREKISANERFHQSLDRVYEETPPRNNTQQVVIEQHNGDLYNIYISNDSDDVVSHFFNSLSRGSEVHIFNDDGDADWSGDLETIHDADESSATLRVEFLSGDRTGTFTDGEGITIEFGYSTINDPVDNNTIERNANGLLRLKEEGINQTHISDDMTNANKTEFRRKINAEHEKGVSIFHGEGQSVAERLPISGTPTDVHRVTDSDTHGIKSLTSSAPQVVIHGGVSITMRNANADSDIDAYGSLDVDNAVMEFGVTGLYHITLHFYGNQVNDNKSLLALMKIESGTDDIVSFVAPGFTLSQALTDDSVTPTSIGKTYHLKYEYFSITDGDKFYIRLDSLQDVDNAGIEGYILIEQV